MLLYLEKRRPTLPCRILSAFIAFTFIFSLVLPPGYAQLIPASPAGGPQTILNLPAPGAMVTPSAAFTPTLIKGLTIHPENPLEFDFIVEKGDNPPQGEEFNKESMKLVKYFLASLTVPEDQMWVNLSPHEKDRIISENLGATEMGKDMLAQDYILKQLTASLMYPENELGKKFWDRIYKKAHEQYGTTEIPVDTFNKVWIVPERAVVYEHGNSAFVVKSHLRVMLEEDYEAKQANQAEDLLRRSNDKAIGRRSPDIRPAVGSSGKVMLEEDYLAGSGQRIADRDEGLTANRSALSAEIIREIILPEIEKEVNAGETFANLRQIYNSMILATWYKKNLRESLLGQVYVDKGKTRGVDLKDPQVNQKIYEQYLEAFKKGVYNYIKEDYDPATKEIIPRKYFSGGAVGLKESNLTTLYRLPAHQKEEIISAFRDIGNTPGARFNKLEIKLYEIAEANNIPEDTMTEIVRGIENTTADEAQNLFVGESSVSSPVMVDGQTPAESFQSVGFKDDLVSMISGTLGLAFEVRRHFQDRRNINKDESIIQRVVWTLQGNENIREIKVAGEPVARVNRGTGEYSVIIAQDYSMVERKSGFSVGTILGVYKEAELIGSIFFLNGPITTMAVTDGKRIAHYAYDGEQFVTRSDVATDLGAPTGKDSPSALGGVYTEWPQLFQDYYLGHGRGVPGSQEAVLKTRYSGVLGEDGLVHGATGANLYEILVNNGFLTEIVSLEQAKILSLFAQGAGGSAFIMTEGGPRSPRDLSGEIPAVQVYLGNKDAVGKLSAYFEARKGEYVPKELRPRFLPVLKKVEVASPFHTVKLEDFLRLEVPDMDERPDLIGAVMAVAQAAQKVGAMYVAGSRATGQIDSGGAKQLAIDEQTDRLFMNALRPWIKEYYSEDLGHVVDFNGDGIRLRVMIDALDGSSRVRGNGGSGTIVNFRKFLPGIPLEEQTGKEIVASMIIAHGITPKLILAIEGMGVYEFILDEGTFYGARAIDLSQPKIREKGLRIALGGERPAWPKGFSELVDQWIQQGAIPGYSGALVTDIWGAINHMLDGGHAIFSYPANKLRVKSELQAIAYLFKVAGGANLTYRHTDGKEAQGLTDLLDVALTPEPDPAKQQKAPSAFGDAQTIQEMRSTLAGSSPVDIREAVRVSVEEIAPQVLLEEREMKELYKILDHAIGVGFYGQVAGEVRTAETRFNKKIKELFNDAYRKNTGGRLGKLKRFLNSESDERPWMIQSYLDDLGRGGDGEVREAARIILRVISASSPVTDRKYLDAINLILSRENAEGSLRVSEGRIIFWDSLSDGTTSPENILYINYLANQLAQDLRVHGLPMESYFSENPQDINQLVGLNLPRKSKNVNYEGLVTLAQRAERRLRELRIFYEGEVDRDKGRPVPVYDRAEIRENIKTVLHVAPEIAGYTHRAGGMSDVVASLLKEGGGVGITLLYPVGTVPKQEFLSNFPDGEGLWRRLIERGWIKSSGEGTTAQLMAFPEALTDLGDPFAGQITSIRDFLRQMENRYLAANGIKKLDRSLAIRFGGPGKGRMVNFSVYEKVTKFNGKRIQVIYLQHPRYTWKLYPKFIKPTETAEEYKQMRRLGLVDEMAAADVHMYFHQLAFEQAVALSQGALEIDRALGLNADVIHAHDWVAGLVPAYMRIGPDFQEKYDTVPVIATIHNLQYQGRFDSRLWSLTGIPVQNFSASPYEFYGDINLLKGSIVFSDQKNTVSRRYAEETRTAEFGENLEVVLNQEAKSNHYRGILNAVDYTVWDPRVDAYLEELGHQKGLNLNYGPEDMNGKPLVKAELQEIFGLPHDPGAFLLGAVGRLVAQKGFDLVADAAEQLLSEGANVQFVLLGTGDKEITDRLAAVQAQYPDKVGLKAVFDDRLAHLIEAGADTFLMPSKFEPSGLNQMYSLRYGTPPIVRKVGGLADTINDGVTGFVFEGATSADLLTEMRRALDLYKNSPDPWKAMMLEGMAKEFSWDKAWSQYLDMYTDAKVARIESIQPASSPVGASEDADDTIGSMVEHSQTPGSLAPVKAKTQELPDYAVEKGKVEDRDPYKEIVSDSRVPGFSPMVIQGAKKKVGGIDLNPALLDLQIKRDGNGVPLPLPMQPIENMHIEGFLPIIINVTPITNLPLLLGLADTESDTEETRPALKAREPEEISSLTVPLSI